MQNKLKGVPKVRTPYYTLISFKNNCYSLADSIALQNSSAILFSVTQSERLM